ncbi:MAG TPA: HlyD family type I secretion periplasmic adaptor subunit [Syntrophales bacterium]|nr:HlyD family type I secretion periplasmic adaptor subunit [Syntrophales bacterium]HOX93829.1 HlyD family type I secretion periplasmic adaptor subunit [Syntrophales bacterium]HPI56997.1 HlyD family type I secretion periplasmic adaptor subunit [Syntrophales bacterium]HPN23873.1 HlyD family type I secretion periplasmic adaptor subunit [Syntrophales bacterium]HQM29984.1 HlyD family type I secretion periplasmic adaptor subunit [Syntrophales bacterium]
MTDYHDFKPILAEVEEKPPNPVGRAFLWTTIAILGLALIGLIFIKVDVVVTARGKIIPAGDVKVLQPLETGVVSKICVREGDYVKAGAPLIEIDPSVDSADLEGKEKNLNLSRVSMARIRAVLDDRAFRPSGEGRASEIVDTQVKLYQSQRALYHSTLREKQLALEEAEHAVHTLQEELTKLENQLAITRDVENRQKSLVEIGALAENRFKEKVRERMSQEREVEAKRGQINEAKARTERVKSEVESFRNSFREKMLSELSSNMQGKNILEAEVTSLNFKKGKRSINAPVSGYVHILSIKTVGGVVTPAQQVVSLVPEDAALMARVLVLNKDAGFVWPGQKCVVKVDTFDFQKYGMIDGAVESVNPFSVEEKENSGDGYPVHVTLASEELKTKDGSTHKVRPGMSVSAEIQVDKRRVVEFFLFPIIKYLDEGLKVR